jgi:hypothetical protein
LEYEAEILAEPKAHPADISALISHDYSSVTELVDETSLVIVYSILPFKLHPI